jgi:hypothetical protein
MATAQAEENPLEATIDWLNACTHDPVRFVREGFPWRQGELANFDGPMAWQRFVVRAAADGLLTPGKAI